MSIIRSRENRLGRPRFSETDYEHMLYPAEPIPKKEVRTDGYDHWIVFVDKRVRCKNPECKGIIQTQCEKCEAYLCFT